MIAMDTTRKIALGIIKQRKLLIAKGNSNKNVMKCLSIIQSLSIQIEAYGNKWNEIGWKSFIARNRESFLFLIPENKSGQTIKNKLDAIL